MSTHHCSSCSEDKSDCIIICDDCFEDEESQMDQMRLDDQKNIKTAVDLFRKLQKKCTWTVGDQLTIEIENWIKENSK